MYKFGPSSTNKLNTCHRDIQLILHEAIKYYDFSVIEGIRSAQRQLVLYKDGKSKLDGINKKSKHQGRGDEQGFIVSYAADVMPYKVGTNAFSGKEKDARRFYFLMGIVKAVSERLYKKGKISHKVRFGCDWDGDDTFDDQNFDDLPHLELI